MLRHVVRVWSITRQIQKTLVLKNQPASGNIPEPPGSSHSDSNAGFTLSLILMLELNQQLILKLKC